MSSIKEAVIISAVRTPVGKFLGALKSFKATDLGAIVVREAVKRAGVKPEDVDEVIMGCVIQAGLGQNPARQAALHGGLPDKVSAVTVNKVCGSGLKAVMMAAQGVQLGDTEIVVAGGMESMSNAPYLIPKAREGYRLGHGKILDSVIQDGLWCAFDDQHMGCTGELVAERFDVSRAEQDEYALNSHRKASDAIKSGKFRDEIVPVEAIQKLLKKTGWSMNDVDLIELNEAFAVQLVAIIRQLDLDPEKVNVNGGAVALGHAIGQSGSRLLTTMLYELKRRDAHRGIAALCLGGGNAVAIAVER